VNWNGPEPNLTVAAIACGMSGVMAAAWCWLGRRVRGLTLIAPWAWTFVPLLAIPTCELVLSLKPTSPTVIGAWRYMAALTLLCPSMALLGAKRPQHRPWSFIVLAFWVVLALPAMRAAILPAGTFQLDYFRLVLVASLALLGLANFLLIHPLVLVFFAVQVFFLFLRVPELEVDPRFLSNRLFLIAELSLCVCIGWVHMGVIRTVPIRHATRRESLNQAWQDFRSLYGVIWSLRVADQLNVTAQRNDWQVQLLSDGFLADELTVELEIQLQRAFENILRRFVSPEWIAARLFSGKQE